eukprot:TRINITY_DN11382_c0_g1_i1.p1 TRINITY_DN11382_c0_g1~~TRINITY_DN11382_c0_g1_i1.p1  ORF type:complete len:262 (-),score=41.17 TRINITY_DN11382_c0_g1_i1:99-884(-)
MAPRVLLSHALSGAPAPHRLGRRKVVIFDLGGVVLESPINLIRAFCEARGILDVNRFLGGSAAWAALERSEITADEFPSAIHNESCTRGYADGIALGVDGWRELLPEMGKVCQRPLMLRTLKRLRAAGIKVAALTNNFTPPTTLSGASPLAPASGSSDFRDLFDHFIESRLTGLRKPDPRIYELALRTVGCDAKDAVFLDDIGANLKPAKLLGIHTIHVSNKSLDSYVDALQQLQEVVGVDLLDGEVLVEKKQPELSMAKL